jgi:hypothetical protein
MHKKLIVACMAMAAFAAFAVTSVASASPVLTHEGKVVATGTKVAGTLEPETTSTFTSSLGNVHCNEATLTGTVTSNTGTHLAGEITKAEWGSKGETETKCTSWAGLVKPTPTGLPWCITSSKVATFTVRGGKCSEAAKPLSFTLDFPGFTCGFERAAASPVNGTNTTGTPATLKITNQAFNRVHGSTFLCPSVGELDMAFYMYTDIEDVGGVNTHIGPLGIS